MAVESGDGFTLRYKASPEGREGRVQVLVSTHLQGGGVDVLLDDPRLAFLVRGESEEDLLVKVHLEARGRDGVRQRDLRPLPFVTILKEWVSVGRDYRRAYLEADSPEVQAERQWVEELARRAGRELNNNTFSSEARHEVAFRSRADSLEQALEDTRAAIARAAVDRRPGQRRRGDDAQELLERVVAEYRNAVARGERAPRPVIGRRLGYSPAHVGRLLVKARKQGLLGQPLTGRAGERVAEGRERDA